MSCSIRRIITVNYCVNSWHCIQFRLQSSQLIKKNIPSRYAYLMRKHCHFILTYKVHTPTMQCVKLLVSTGNLYKWPLSSHFQYQLNCLLHTNYNENGAGLIEMKLNDKPSIRFWFHFRPSGPLLLLKRIWYVYCQNNVIVSCLLTLHIYTMQQYRLST